MMTSCMYSTENATPWISISINIASFQLVLIKLLQLITLMLPIKRNYVIGWYGNKLASSTPRYLFAYLDFCPISVKTWSK